jgi:hypothetical protein
VSAARDVAVGEVAFGDASCVAFLLQFAAGEGKQSGGEARRRRCDLCDLRVMLVPVKLRSVTRGVSLSCRSLRRGRENIRVKRQDIGGVKRIGVNVMPGACG